MDAFTSPLVNLIGLGQFYVNASITKVLPELRKELERSESNQPMGCFAPCGASPHSGSLKLAAQVLNLYRFKS
jgi:hypothetical protein